VWAPYGDAATLADGYRVLRAKFAAPYADVPAALRRLRGNHQIWVTTNGDSELQRRKLRVSTLSTLVDRVFVSADIGAAKPYRTFYAAVEEALGRTGQHVALVLGDSYTRDLAPALDRGWPVLGVRRSPTAVTARADDVNWATDLSDVGVVHDAG
jgi:FMN phosphatase YigB (HAD superfamily)